MLECERYLQAVGGVDGERGDGVRRALLQRHQRGLEAGSAPSAARAARATHAQALSTRATAPHP